MSKLMTINNLQDRIDNEFAWRLKELDTLKKTVKNSSLIAQKTAIRAAVCLAYSHWEGFVKRAAESYIEFVSNQRLRYEQLADCFVLIGAKRHLSAVASEGSISAAVSSVGFFRNGLGDRAYLRLPNHVKTRANLNSEVFEDIAITVGVSPDAFRSRYNQIDESLLGRRNRIAHGEYLDLDQQPCLDLIEDVIGLLRLFKELIEESASKKSYVRQSPCPADS